MEGQEPIWLAEYTEGKITSLIICKSEEEKEIFKYKDRRLKDITSEEVQAFKKQQLYLKHQMQDF